MNKDNKPSFIPDDIDTLNDIELGTYIDARERYDYLLSSAFLNDLGLNGIDPDVHNVIDKKVEKNN